MKAGIADPKKTTTARQRHGNYLSAVTNNHETTQELLQTMFSIRSVPSLYKENQVEFSVSQEYEGVAIMG
jgi:hypothetical protein